MKFTKEETKKAMSMAMKLRKEFSIELNCKFNEVDMSYCLKISYKQIRQEKLKIKNVVKSIKHVFDQNEIGKIKNGWDIFPKIAKDLGYKISITGSNVFTHAIDCTKEDFNVIKEMIMEV